MVTDPGDTVPQGYEPQALTGTLTLILQALQQNGVQLGQIIQTLENVFPQALGTASSATGGAATLPANPVGFLTVVNPTDGSTVLIPYYDA